MVIALWIVNVVAALAFLATGLLKAVRSKEALRTSGLPWVEDFPGGVITLIGVVEAIGAVGLIVPLWTGIAPILAPVAAVGLTLLMIGAVVVHVRRKEMFLPPLVFGLLALASAILGFLVVAG